MFCSILGLGPLEARSIFPPGVTTKTVSRHCQMSPRGSPYPPPHREPPLYLVGYFIYSFSLSLYYELQKSRISVFFLTSGFPRTVHSTSQMLGKYSSDKWIKRWLSRDFWAPRSVETKVKETKEYTWATFIEWKGGPWGGTIIHYWMPLLNA